MNPIEPTTTVSDWLGTSTSHSKRQINCGDRWWALPSPTRPRIYVSASPTAWKQSLRLVNSPYKRLISSALLATKSLLRSPAQWNETGPSPLREWLSEIFPSQSLFHFAIYIGTPSIFVKDTIQCMGANGETLAFLKVPRGSSAASAVNHEAQTLAQLADRFPGKNFFPAVLGHRNGQFLQAPPPASLASRPSNPAKILADLREHWSESFPWSESPAHHSVLESIPVIRSAGADEWADVLLFACDTIGRHFGDHPIPHPMSHGDFIRWNILPGPFAFDWEWAAPRLPWHDAFHYLWMPLLGTRHTPSMDNLWRLWIGSHGKALRANQSSTPEGILYGIGYLASQFAFYSKSSAMEGLGILENTFLNRIHQSLKSILTRI